MAFGGQGGKSAGGNKGSGGKKPRENKSKGVEKKVEKQPENKLRPKVLEVMAKKEAKKQATQERKAQALEAWGGSKPDEKQRRLARGSERAEKGVQNAYE